MTPAERLKELMRDIGCDQTRLALLTGSHPSLISKYLSGKRDITPDFAYSLQKRLGWSLDYILSGEGPKFVLPYRGEGDEVYAVMGTELARLRAENQILRMENGRLRAGLP